LEASDNVSAEQMSWSTDGWCPRQLPGRQKYRPDWDKMSPGDKSAGTGGEFVAVYFDASVDGTSLVVWYTMASKSKATNCRRRYIKFCRRYRRQLAAVWRLKLAIRRLLSPVHTGDYSRRCGQGFKRALVVFHLTQHQSFADLASFLYE